MAQPRKDPKKHLVAGVAAGVITTTSLHPLDLIKVRFQAADGAARNLPKYGGTLDALKQIVLSERGRGLYKGLSPAVTGSGMSWGLYFFFYERAKARYLAREQRTYPDQATHSLSPVHHMAAAWEGGSITVLCTNPVWLVKTRMQLQVAQVQSQEVGHAVKRYPTMWSSFKWIVRHEGVPGLYRGLVPALFLTSHGMVQFGVYEELKRLTSHLGDNSLLYGLSGGLSKVIASVATYPAQVVKTRLQQDAEVTGTQRYSNVANVISRTIKNEGVRGFYKGMAPHMYRGVLASAVTFVAYENVLSMLG